MPLKPIFEKAPLTSMSSQSLHAGFVRSDSEVLKKLYKITADADRPSALEGTFRLACMVCAKPDGEPSAQRIRELLNTQQEDGSFDVSLADAIAILRAAWTLYEYEAKKPVLEHIARWCTWAAQNWADVMAEDAVWANPADLMELLLNFYRVSGKMAILKLCERLNSEAMVWSSVLNTIAVQRPTSRAITKRELENGLATENGDRGGYYTNYARTNAPLQLADGARSAMANAWFTGSATEMNATRNGWERLWRYHGAVCGGLSSDELLEGTAPSVLMSTAALGAWSEALCAAAMTNDAVWAWEALERMYFNAMPAAVKADHVLSFQRVNALSDAVSSDECFLVGSDHDNRSLDRLVRGYVAAASSAVAACPGGVSINLYLEGKYGVQIDDRLLMLSMAESDSCCRIVLHCKDDVKAVLKLRIPQWSKSTDIHVNGTECEAGSNCTGSYVKLERLWHDGDVITLHFDKVLRVHDAHHQGKYVTCGPVLMAMPATDDWKKSFVSAALKDGMVVAVCDEAAEWKASCNQPADIPVLPAPSGKAVTEIQLRPYAEVTERIALFPGRKNG